MKDRAYFETLAKVSYLDVLLPKTSDFDIVRLLSSGSPDELSRAPARRNLFFDEQASVVLVLRTSEPEEKLRGLIPSLELVLSAHATDAVPQGSGNTASASGKHDLESKTIAASTYDQLVTISGKTYVVWRPSLHLSRPRARLQRPAIYFTANLAFTNDDTRCALGAQHDFLKSFEPLPANVLEPLQFDPTLRNTDVSLPESRITKVAPRAPRLHDLVKPIRGATKRAFPAVPALFTKIRYSALPDSIVASLHLETSPIIAGIATINNVSLEVSNATVNHLTDVSLPLETQGGDETIVVYKIHRDRSKRSAMDSDTQILSVTVSAKALLDQGSTIDFELKWQSQVNLIPTPTKLDYRWSRPLSVASAHQRGSSMQSSSGILSNDASQKPAADKTGIIISISGPATVNKGSDFVMKVQCSNHSSRTRKFAILMLQKRRSKTADSAHGAVVDVGLVAKIFNAPALEVTKPLDVLDLSPEVRIGPLTSGACFETQLCFKALSAGLLNLATMRVLDLDTKQVVDVRELPDIVALG